MERLTSQHLTAIHSAINAIQGARLELAMFNDIYAKLGEALKHARIAEDKAERLLRNQDKFK